MKNLVAWNKDTDTIILPERLPVALEWALYPSGIKKQYPGEPVAPIAPISILITGITGDVLHSSDFTKSTMYEGTNITITGSLAIPDQNFALPIRRNDGRLFIFLAQVVDGAFSVVLNFPTCGSFVYSDEECNIDLPYAVFTVDTMKFDVLRKIPA